MGKLDDELSRLERQLDALDQNDSEKLLAAQEWKTKRIERIVHGLHTGEDMSGFASPEEVEEIGEVLAQIAPALEELEKRGAVEGPPPSPFRETEQPGGNDLTKINETAPTSPATTPEEVHERLRGGEGIPHRHRVRLRRFLCKQWQALDEVYLSREADPSKVERWRQASEHSPDRAKAADFERALRTLALWAKLESRL